MIRRVGAGPLALAAVALGIGFAIAWLDSRPTWDDTGITAVLLFVTSAAT